MRCFPVIPAACALLFFSGMSFADMNVKAYLYNPKTDSAALTYPYPHESDRHQFSPNLVVSGTGVADGAYQLDYSIESGGMVAVRGSAKIEVIKGVFSQEVKLDRRYPAADRVRWELKGRNAASSSGVAALKWSRFHGRVVFRDPRDKADAYIDMYSFGFGAPGSILIPIDGDGRFDALVPARIYRVININSTGYLFNAMERWAWDYDLTRDREEEFTIGRMEIYSIRAFEIIGGPPTLFVAFRPSTLTRVLRFDSDRNGQIDAKEREAINEALKRSCTAIGPELKAENVTVWIDGKSLPVVQLTQVPEYDGDGSYQVQYLVQVYPEGRLRGASHEIKVEVESEEELDGRKIRDFGQGSVGYYPLGYSQELL